MTTPGESPQPDPTPIATGVNNAPSVETATSRPRVKRTRLAGTWVAILIAVVILAFLLVFILQNLNSSTVSFLGMSGTLPLGVALLLAALAGAILVALVGTGRILQLRRHAKLARQQQKK